jgi:hypothetical protein
MANILEKAISILAGNLNLGHSYLITTVEKHSVLRSKVFLGAKCSEKLSVPGNKRC